MAVCLLNAEVQTSFVAHKGVQGVMPQQQLLMGCKTHVLQSVPGLTLYLG